MLFRNVELLRMAFSARSICFERTREVTRVCSRDVTGAEN